MGDQRLGTTTAERGTGVVGDSGGIDGTPPDHERVDDRTRPNCAKRIAAEIRANQLNYSIWPGNYVVVLPPQLRDHFDAAGWSKDDVANCVYERARVRRGDWAGVGKGAVVKDRADREYPALEGAGRPADRRSRRTSRWFRSRYPAMAGHSQSCCHGRSRRLRRLRGALNLPARDPTGRRSRQTRTMEGNSGSDQSKDTYEGLLVGLPDDYLAAVEDYHRLAYAIVGEARRVATGRFGLRSLAKGFGTPVFDVPMGRAGEMECQVWIAGDELFAEEGGVQRSTHITTLAAAAGFIGVSPGTEAREHDSPELGDTDRWLRVSPEVGAHLVAWYRLGADVLEQLRALPGAVDADEIQLWPGHFDMATAIGDAGSGTRATYGLSPGDAAHPHPYAYVGPWGKVNRSDPFWNDAAFGGASLPYSAMLAAANPADAAFEFLFAGFDGVNG